MKLQKKLDDLGDRLRNHEGHQPTDKLDTSNPPKGHEATGGGFHPKDTDVLITAENKDGKSIEARDVLNKALNREDNNYDLEQKGKMFDALKKRNVELVEALRIVKDYIEYPHTHHGTTRIRKAVEQALKNNNND